MMKPKSKLTVIGMGSLIKSDDGIGIQILRKLKENEELKEVPLLEVGTSPMNYLEKISNSKIIIGIDAVYGGEGPGSIYRFTLDEIERKGETRKDAHGFSLPDVIELARARTGFPIEVIIYGIEPLDLSLNIQLSSPVKKALPKAVTEIKKEIKQISSAG
ncbi:hydrogenase maturation protease [Acetohalobium arabaticum]|nr:hydrogenase maturation protease [Acetohalobium arabaticum]